MSYQYGTAPPPPGFAVPPPSSGGASESAWPKPPPYYAQPGASQPSAPLVVNAYTSGGGKAPGEPLVPPEQQQQQQQQQAAGMPPAGYDVSYAGAGVISFSETSVRNAFVRKVYAILSLQLVLTGAIVALFTFVTPIRSLATSSPGAFLALLIVSMVVMIVLCVTLSIWQTGARTFPINMILLGIITVATGVMLGCVCSLYSADIVMYAMCATILIAVGLTLFSFQTRYMFSIWWGLGVVLVISLVFFVVMIVVNVTILTARQRQMPFLFCLYGFCGVLLFSAYLVIDTQLLLGGCRGIAISPEDYIYASLQLYLDLVNIFLYLLMLLASAKK